MRLLDGEPEFPIDRWQPVAAVVGRDLAQKPVQGRPFLLAVDGRSANGKSTFADRVASVLPRTSVVHTDDIAWWHSRFGWDDLLVAGVLEPLRQGKPVDYRPPAWDARHRAGSITVPAGAALVVSRASAPVAGAWPNTSTAWSGSKPTSSWRGAVTSSE